MRYLPLSAHDRSLMLKEVGIEKQEELYSELPESIFPKNTLELSDGKSELEVEKYLKSLAQKNINSDDKPFFLGGGCYKHHIPAVVDHIIQRAEYLTSYTPYQPEISQGTLATLFEFQSMLCSLTGMDVANASLYDGATSVVEAILMALRIKKAPNILIANELNPDYLRVVETYLKNKDNKIFLDENAAADLAAIIVQTPDYNGTPHNLAKWRKYADEHDALLIVVVSEIVSLGILPAPKEADIVVGEGQSLGIPMNFGGPHLGIFACKKKYLRQIPGRICGATKDQNGKDAFVLTLNTREQHIRRHKATSNICSNQGLNVVAFTIHLALLGKKGLKNLAKLNHHKANKLNQLLAQIPEIQIENKSFFNEFTYKTPKPAQEIISKMYAAGIFAGIAISENRILVTITETNSDQEIELYAENLKKIFQDKS